jgi:hypothetical protein
MNTWMGQLVQELAGPASAITDKTLAIAYSRLMDTHRRLKIVATLIVPLKTLNKVNGA